MINIQTVFSRFEFGSIFDKNPDVIIVDDCPLEKLSDPKIKLIISEEKLLIEKKGKEPRLVPNVKWIFTVCIDRRFSVITV
jgi:hypothetical protein